MSSTQAFRDALARALPERPFRVELWDGTALEPTSGGGPTFRLNSPAALGHVLRAPSQLGVGRAYVSGGIDVDDIDAALADLAEIGVQPEKPPYHPGDREDLPRIAFVADPDGYRIELIDGGEFRTPQD